MTRTTRHLMVGALMTLAGGGRAAAAAGVDTPAMPRVRSHHPGIASLGKPSVADVTSRYFSYQRIGRLGTYTAFETQAMPGGSRADVDRLDERNHLHPPRNQARKSRWVTWLRRVDGLD